MLDFIFFQIELNTLVLWVARVIFLFIGIFYVIYIMLQIRQIGIMNNTLKTKAGVPIGLIGILHLILVVLTVIIVELLLFFQK